MPRDLASLASQDNFDGGATEGVKEAAVEIASVVHVDVTDFEQVPMLALETRAVVA